MVALPLEQQVLALTNAQIRKEPFGAARRRLEWL